MGAADDVVTTTAESIASGQQVDWTGVRQQPLDAERSSVLSEMEVLERIATFLRDSAPLDVPAPPTPSTVERLRPPMPASWAQFTILELIGEGGFGKVYRARDTKLQTDVALKLIKLPADRKVSERDALKEPRLLAKVRHVNVVTVHGADIVDGCVGIWMQLIEGQTLASQLRGNGPFGSQEAALVGVDLCRALAAVHAAGLIHGDVKTRNVMREAGGRTVLMDFGTGRDLSALRLHGAADAPAGTPLYLAPEVFDDQPQSRASDVYSLGVLLFHLVSNEYPVKGQTQAEIEDAHRRRERIHLRDVRPDLPQSFISLVERALSRDPRDRFQTMGAFESVLAECLGRPSLPDPRPVPRRRWLNIAAVTVGMVLLSAATFWVTRQFNEARPRTVVAQSVLAGGAAVADGYQIEPALYKHGQNDARLKAGDRVAPGDQLFMKLNVSAPTYLYVVNEDDRGDSFLLFPLPGQAVENPIRSDTPVRIPGTGDDEINWVLTSVGEREHFIVFASPERMQAFEEVFAKLPRPEIGKPILSAPIPKGTLSKLRAVGGLTAPPPQTSLSFSTMFTAPLIERAETAHGMWVRQLTLLNPSRDR
jgi:serine/threonine protein kinase